MLKTFLTVASVLGIFLAGVLWHRAQVAAPRTEVRSWPQDEAERIAEDGLRDQFLRFGLVPTKEGWRIAEGEVAAVSSDQAVQRACAGLVLRARLLGAQEEALARVAERRYGVAVAAIGTQWVERRS